MVLLQVTVTYPLLYFDACFMLAARVLKNSRGGVARIWENIARQDCG